MLKVKKKIGKTSSVNKNQDEISKIQNELKNSMKKSYLNEKRKQLTNMHNLLHKLEKNMRNYSMKTFN